MHKIGIVAQYLNSRNDIRVVIEKLTTYYDVTLYLRKNDLNISIPKVKIREIQAKKRSIKNQLLVRLFFLFGKIPSSRNNYFITEAFKIENTKTKKLFKAEKKLLLWLSKYTPRFLSYDNYLESLDIKHNTAIGEIDTFLCFSEVYDDYLLGHLFKANKKVLMYVYSWDHPCKMMRFSQKVNHYFVWNKGLKSDMIELQGVNKDKITVLGSSQLAYIADFKKVEDTANKPFDFDYIYFGCATATPALVKQEVEIIKQIAEVLHKNFPNIRLLVRPYPFLALWDTYSVLEKYQNIVFDADYRDSKESFALSRERIYEKFIKIKFAKAFIHAGTTMGFEATYFKTPVLQINFAEPSSNPLSLYNFIHQYQNDKYLLLKSYPNVIFNIGDFTKKLDALLKRPDDFLKYNEHISEQTHLQDFDELILRLINVLHKGPIVWREYEGK